MERGREEGSTLQHEVGTTRDLTISPERIPSSLYRTSITLIFLCLLIWLIPRDGTACSRGPGLVPNA